MHLVGSGLESRPGYQLLCVGLEVLTEAIMKSTILWNITPYSPLKVDRHFEGICRLYLQGRVSQARNQHEVGNKQSQQTHAGFLISLFLNPADGGDMLL
jgi:hypothetical protein